jgi:hypothetical protein
LQIRISGDFSGEKEQFGDCAQAEGDRFQAEGTDLRSFAKIDELLSQSAPLAQLDRASDYESEGREFESLRARHLFRSLTVPASILLKPLWLFTLRSFFSSYRKVSEFSKFLRQIL